MNANASIVHLRACLVIAAIAVLGGTRVPARAQCDPHELAVLVHSLNRTQNAGAAPDSANPRGSPLTSNHVALSGDTAIVGIYDGSGLAHVFVRTGDMWIEQQELVASDPGGTFGYPSVALSGDTAVVGTDYDADGGINAGAAYVFVRSGETWTQQAKLTASDAVAGQRFGLSVAIEGDVVVIGAPGPLSNSQGTYVFTRNGSVWTQAGKLRTSAPVLFNQGTSVGISGDTIVVGAIGLFAWVFVKPVGGWVNSNTPRATLNATDDVQQDSFGLSVAIEDDTVAVGAPTNGSGIGAGAVYIFKKPVGGWHNVNQTAKLTASDAVVDDKFGNAVSLSGDRLLVGAFKHSYIVGAAYLFLEPPGGWMNMTETAAIVPSEGDNPCYFGSTTGISNDLAIIGQAGPGIVYDLLPVTYPGDIDGDHGVDNADATMFVDVLIGTDTDILHVGRADVDCSGVVDGLDLQPFVVLLLN